LGCPFCAASDWLEAGAQEFMRDSSPIYCISCERSAELHVTDNGMEIHFLAGPPPPEWLEGVIMPEIPSAVRFSNGHLEMPTIEPHPRRLPPGISKMRKDPVKPTRPPNFRQTRGKVKNCHTCAHVDRAKGVCKLYGGWPVKPNEICDTWKKDDA
jgi:hypothetical protein